MASTTQDLVTGVRDLVGADTAGYLSDASIVRWLNIGQRDLCKSGDILCSGWTASTVDGQEQYSVPADYLKVVAVYLQRSAGDNAKIQLFPLPGGIRGRDPRGGQGTPRWFYPWGINVSGANSRYIGLQPIPDANVAASDLIMFGRQLARDLDLLSLGGGHADVNPELETEWTDELIHFAASRAFTRMTRHDPGVASLADREMAMWEHAIKKAKGYRNPMALGVPTIRPDDYTPGFQYD